jgi:hypothetical protein
VTTKCACHICMHAGQLGICVVISDSQLQFTRAHTPRTAVASRSTIHLCTLQLYVCVLLDDLYVHTMLGSAHEQKTQDGGAVDRCGQQKCSVCGPYQTIQSIIKRIF